MVNSKRSTQTRKFKKFRNKQLYQNPYGVFPVITRKIESSEEGRPQGDDN